MRGFVIAAAFALSASPVFAQAPGQAPARPAQPQTAPARPATPPAAPPQFIPPPQVPFPAGAKIGFVNLQAIAQLTADGKAAAAKVNEIGRAHV